MMRTALAGIAALLTAGAAAAQPVKHTRVSLVSELEAVQAGRPFTLALRLEMDPDWHTYWINPGDSGLPTKIAWELPEGFEVGELQWPRPEVFSVGPLVSYGYSDEVLLLADLRAPEGLSPGATVRLAGRAEWLECEEICLPGKAPVEISLPVTASPPEPSEWAQRFAETRALLPAAAPAWALAAGTAGDTAALAVSPPAGWEGTPQEAYFFPLEADVIDYAAPQQLVVDGGGYRLEMSRAPNAARLEELRGVLVADAGGPGGGELVLDVRAAVSEDVSAAIGRPGERSARRRAELSLPLALLFAFVGGLILNLMPCVLPVLSLKVMGLVRDAGDDPSRAWRHGLAFTAGVLVFFLGLAGVLIGLRAAGDQVGWGFQLQSPSFVAFLGFLFFAIALNLFGVFEVGTSLTGAGGAAVQRGGLGGAFWSGALATIVATPCTAPFMGAAMGYTLAQPAWISLLVFAFLALGMAAPYLLLSRFPRLLRAVPRPGAWMEGFKQLMGFFIMGTVVFLCWLFGRQVGVDAVGLLLAGLVLAGLGAWVYGRGAAPGRAPRTRLAAVSLALVLTVAGLLVGFAPAQAAAGSRGARPLEAAGLPFEPFSPERLAELRGQGTRVFIDFTADWCLTCQVNERVAFTAEVRDRFAEKGVVLLEADWTLRDDSIGRALEGYGRQGVPLYVLYGRDGEPRLLPEILSPGILLDALDTLP
jgi:thiol:disulfide interchange protein DsbD